MLEHFVLLILMFSPQYPNGQEFANGLSPMTHEKCIEARNAFYEELTSPENVAVLKKNGIIKFTIVCVDTSPPGTQI
jgi:hypothetical protein